jgi:hypothetical protein
VHSEDFPYEGEVEYLHCIPASRRRQQEGKSQIWDSKIGSWVPRGSNSRMTALARASSNCKRQTRPLVRESVPHQQTNNCLTVIKIWSEAPDGCFIPRQTGRLTVGRNIRLRLIRRIQRSVRDSFAREFERQFYRWVFNWEVFTRKDSQPSND